MISFAFAFEGVCSVCTPATMLAGVRNTCIEICNKLIHTYITYNIKTMVIALIQILEYHIRTININCVITKTIISDQVMTRLIGTSFIMMTYIILSSFTSNKLIYILKYCE